MKTFLKLLQSIIFWTVLYFIRLPLIIIGLVVVPIAYPFRKDNHFPKWAWLWDNREDGIYGIPWWIKKNNNKKNFKTCFGWSAIRNPVNNMRFLKLFSVVYGTTSNEKIYGDKEIPHPKLARELGRAVWHLTLVKTGILWRFSYWYIKAKPNKKHFRIRIGWKCTPEWITGKNINEINKYSGITFQLMPNRNG